MAAIFNRQKGSCGCRVPVRAPDEEDGDFSAENSQLRPLGVNCCYSVDLDVVYDQMVVYTEDNTPCEPCLNRKPIQITCEEDEEGNCVSCTASYVDTPPQTWPDDSTSPHGRVSDWEVPQCSKLVILKGVVVDGTSLSYESVSIFKARKRGTNPGFFYNGNQDPPIVNCGERPICNPISPRKCCYGQVPHPSGPSYHLRTYFEYRGCTVATDVSPNFPSYENCVTCDPADASMDVFYSNWVLPCYMDYDVAGIPEAGIPPFFGREYMLAYRKEDSWWFVTDELPNLYESLAQNDPYKKRKHNIAIHFEVNSKSIRCCRKHCPDRPEPGSVPCGTGTGGCEYTQNDRPGFCGHLDPWGTYNALRYITDKDTRERATKIYAVAGYYTGCGADDLLKLCDKHFE